MWTKLWTRGEMYKLKYKELIHFTKGKDDVAEKLENRLLKYSELGNFGIRNLNSFSGLSFLKFSSHKSIQS